MILQNIFSDLNFPNYFKNNKDNLFDIFFNDYENSTTLEHNDKHNNKQKQDLKTSFYWEDLKQKCPYNPKLKYCIYFRGCCCPPHIGHINSIKMAVKQFPGCKVIVNQIGCSKRHGTPTDFNSELLQKYLSVIFKNTQVKYILKESSKNIFKSDYVIDSDVLVIIRGDEINNDNFNKEYAIEMYKKKKEIKNKNYIKFLNKNGVKLVFLMQGRNVNKISASKFIEHLNIYKNKLSKGHNAQKYLEKVMSFIPNELNYEEKNEIIKKMLEFKTW
jgi:phosphopantetheine adenylyltransferase